MRSRFLSFWLSCALIVGFAACSKKDNSQQAQTAPATTSQPADQSAQSSSATPAGNADNSAAQTAGNTASGSMPPAPQAAPEPPPPPPPLEVPAGTSVVVRMGSSLSSKTANVGDSFTGTLAHSISVGGEVAIPSGAGVAGSVVEAKSPGKFKGEGILAIQLHSINVGGVPMNIDTSTYAQTVKGKGKRTAVAVGGGTGAGALIGGLAGGGKGALIGGLVGAGAGTAGAAFTGNKELEIPAESVVTFKLASSISVKRPAKSAAASDQQ